MAVVLACATGLFVTELRPMEALLIASGAFFTCGYGSDALKQLPVFYRLAYVVTAFVGVCLGALFVTVLARVSFRDAR